MNGRHFVGAPRWKIFTEPEVAYELEVRVALTAMNVPRWHQAGTDIRKVGDSYEF